MILCDDRVGSREFLNPLRHLGVQAQIEHLKSADFAFAGNGPEGPVVVGIERKTIREMIDHSDRFSGSQVRVLSKQYDIRYLVVEGHFRPNPESHILETRKEDWGKWYKGFGKPVFYGELAAFLIGLGMHGVQVLFSGDEAQTTAWVVWAYKYFQKEWNQHKSLHTIYVPPPARPGNKMRWEEPSQVTRVASVIPGLDQKAWEVGKVFRTPREMFTAPREKWIIAGKPKNGRKVTVIGEGMMEKIQNWMDGK